MNKAFAAALIAALFGITGCATETSADNRNPAPCPNIVVLNDAARMIEFDGEEILEDVAYTAEITNVSIGCRYTEAEPIDTSIGVELAFGRGPKGEAEQKNFTYFVAVTRKDLEVITKKEFTLPIEFSEKRSVVVLEDEVDEIFIPRAGDQISGANFEIIVGLKLTPQQAIFNRSGKSLKFPQL